MAIQVNDVGPLTRINPQRRTAFEVRIETGPAVLLQFAAPGQAALSRARLCERVGPVTNRRTTSCAVRLAESA